MKRITKPQSDMPEVYKQQVEEQKQTLSTVSLEEDEPSVQQVPPTRYGSIHLKNFESFRSSRVRIKLDNQEVLAFQELSMLSKMVDPSVNSMNQKLLVDVIDFLEDFFIYGSSEDRTASKEKVLKKVMLPYFKHDEEFLGAMVKSVEHLVHRSTRFSRRWSKLKNSFFFVLSLLSKESVVH
jgi:hypothetical protein